MNEIENNNAKLALVNIDEVLEALEPVEYKTSFTSSLVKKLLISKTSLEKIIDEKLISPPKSKWTTGIVPRDTRSR